MEIKCEFHSHSHYSKGGAITVEGFNSPEEMVERAKKIGLNCIALTDHDMIKGNKEAVKAGKKHGITVIPGEEVRTAGVDYKMRGHVLALGIGEAVKPGLSVEETIDKIHEQGAIAIASHPFDISRRGVREKSVLCDAIESFNAINIERLANWKTKMYAKEHGLIGVTGSDAHWTEMLGYSYTICNADNNIDSILKAIKNGNVRLRCHYVPSDIMTTWAVKRLQMSYDNVQKYVNENYSYPKRAIALELLKIVKKSPGRVDYFINLIGKIGIVGATGYSAMKLLFDL